MSKEMERRKQEHIARHSQKRKLQRWDDAQEKYLIAIMGVDDANYVKAADAMAGEFGIRRTPDACERKHSELTSGVIRRKPKGKGPSQHKRSWKAAHEAFVLNNFNVLPIDEIAKKIGRTEDAVKDRFHLLMRVKGTSVVVGEKFTRIEQPQEITHSPKYPDYIPKRWIIREIKQQHRAKVRKEKAESKQRIKLLKEQMKEEIRRIRNDE